MSRRSPAALLAPLCLGSLLACGGDKDPAAAGADSADTGTDWASLSCAEAPVVTWANFGQGFLTHHCQGCHASTSPNRYGAPENVSFDTLEEAWRWSDRILLRATGDAADMPPAGGTTADDRQKLDWWLSCAREGT